MGSFIFSNCLFRFISEVSKQKIVKKNLRKQTVFSIKYLINTSFIWCYFFRFCQIGLWGNMGDRLTGALCKNLLGNLLNLQQLPGQLPNLPGQLPGQVPLQLPGQNNAPLVPGLFGKQPTKAPQPRRTTKAPSFKLPFDFLL